MKSDIERAAALPDEVRQVFTLRKVYGFNYQQIAARLSLPIETVKKDMASAAILMAGRRPRNS